MEICKACTHIMLNPPFRAYTGTVQSLGAWGEYM